MTEPSRAPREEGLLRTLRTMGAVAAFLAVLGLAALGLWLMLRLPRF